MMKGSEKKMQTQNQRVFTWIKEIKVVNIAPESILKEFMRAVTADFIRRPHGELFTKYTCNPSSESGLVISQGAWI